MLFKVYGKKGVRVEKVYDKLQGPIDINDISGRTSIDLMDEVVNVISENSDPEDNIEVIDIPFGDEIRMADEVGIYYLPTIVCIDEETGAEIGVLENDSSFKPNTSALDMSQLYNKKYKENDGQVFDANLSYVWWIDLRNFVEYMKRLKNKDV